MVWVKSPLTETTERCLLGPALLKLPHRELASVFLSHFTLGRNLHLEFSQIVPVQTAGPAARLTCRILRELMIHLEYCSQKCCPAFYGTAWVSQRIAWCLHRDQRSRPKNTQFGRFRTYFLCHFITGISSVFKCPSTENRITHKKDFPINLPTYTLTFLSLWGLS